MMLTEENYKESITALSTKDWKVLFDLIPEIEKTLEFGKMHIAEANADGTKQFPHWQEAPVVSKFRNAVYEIPIIINFDWSSWDEGAQMASDKDFNFDNIDIPTKCKLITAIIRNDRFCEGALLSAFESGLILRIVKSLLKSFSKILPIPIIRLS